MIFNSLDGSIDAAIPPLKILLHIMAYGHYDGKEISDPELRAYFERDYIIKSDWYLERLKLKQQKDIGFYKKQLSYLEKFISNPNNESLVIEMNLVNQLERIKSLYQEANSNNYIEQLVGTIGADPLYRKL